MSLKGKAAKWASVGALVVATGAGIMPSAMASTTVTQHPSVPSYRVHCRWVRVHTWDHHWRRVHSWDHHWRWVHGWGHHWRSVRVCRRYGGGY